ncbi:MAG: hypothetical protein IKP78_09955 [Ruminococcus sp.]|nr:hypothetical protein [Ruminococcus sp.]
MERKLNLKRVIIVGALALALLAVIGACIAVIVSHGKGKKSANQPLLCEEPVFPATLAAEGGTYTRKLSTYWWVKDANNGKVILEDVNRFRGGAVPDADLGVVDLQGRVVITCDNREVHFTDKGYIATWHVDKNSSTYNYFNMGGNCLASLDSTSAETIEKYGEVLKTSEKEHAEITDKVDGSVKYFGKYAVVSERDEISKKKQTNTCVYEFKAAG